MMSMCPFLAARCRGLVPLGSVMSPSLGSRRATHMLLLKSSCTTWREPQERDLATDPGPDAAPQRIEKAGRGLRPPPRGDTQALGPSLSGPEGGPGSATWQSASLSGQAPPTRFQLRWVAETLETSFPGQ